MPKYIEPEEFENAISQYRTNPSDAQAQVVLYRLFYLLANNLVRTFSRGCDYEEAIQDLVVLCWEKMGRYELGRSSGFSYFTQIMKNELRYRHRLSQRDQELVRRYAIQLIQEGRLPLSGSLDGTKKIPQVRDPGDL